jgi:iron complex outermembrane recepter protein
MVSRKTSLLMSAPLVILCTAGARPAAADEAPPPPAPAAAAQEPMLLEEIIVTAEKQASGRPLQIVPIAITAIDAGMIQESHVQNIVDIGHMAPNVVLDASGTLLGTAAFTIRGVGERSSTASIDPAVAVTQDGMPLSLQTGLALLGTFDTENVQILRGPQGVLQGVGAAGGAVTFTTPLPTDTFYANSSVTAGNFDTIGATATISGPLSDKVLGKIAVYEQRTAGYYNNTTDEGTYVVAKENPSGLEPQHATGLVGGTQVVVVKPTFLINISDTVKLKVFAQFESDNDGGSATQIINPNPGVGPVVQFIKGFGYTPTPQNYQTNLSTPGWTHITEEHLIGELDANVGSGVWTTNAAIRNVNYNSVFNNAGSPFNAFLVYTQEENRQASIESRWSGALSDKINFLAGIYLFDDNLPVQVVDSTNLGELSLPLAVPTNVNSPLNMNNQLIQYNQKTTSAAAFTNVDYSILSNLTLSGGVRYQYEHKIMDIQPGAGPTAVIYCTTGTLTGCPTTWYNPSKVWNTPTWRALLSWQATRDVMTYVSYTRGWAAGNFNGSPSTLGAALVAANPETVDSYELGMKSEWFDHRFRANFAVFDEKFDNIQRTATTAIDNQHVQTLINAASATIKGAEMELTALPFDGVKLFATGGYTNAVYNSFNAAVNPDKYNPSEGLTELGFANLPSWTTDAGGTYTFSLPNVEGPFSFTADYSWRSKQWGDFGNTPQEVIKAYGLVNGSISHTAGPWTVALWGRNLTNKYYDEAAAIAGGFQQWPGVPRTYGLTAYLKFQ